MNGLLGLLGRLLGFRGEQLIHPSRHPTPAAQKRRRYSRWQRRKMLAKLARRRNRGR